MIRARRRAGVMLAGVWLAVATASVGGATAPTAPGSDAGHDNGHDHAPAPAPSPSTVPAHDHQHHLDTANGKPDRVITGPQGMRGQFLVECELSHVAADDPIVYPGQPGASHRHAFFGNDTVDAFSTTTSMAAGGTTCEQRLDRAAYWVPVLFDGDREVAAIKSTAYYRAGLDVDPTTVEPYPQGLAMIAGSAAATAPQPIEVVAWTCGVSGLRSATPPECAPDRMLRMIVTFPDCWNGTDLDTADHIAHLAYSTAGACPPTHPRVLPQLQFSVEYDHHGSTAGLHLASGGVLSGHADFINVWDADKLRTEVESCIHRDVVCGITSGRRTG